MKKLFTLTMLISFALICSCQKQDSAAERQLAQRKAELDARDKALDEREKALTEKVRAQRDKTSQQVLEKLQRMKSGASGSPAATFANPLAASPEAEASSPSPSPTPQ